MKLLLTYSLFSTKVISAFTWKSCLTPLKVPQPPRHQPTTRPASETTELNENLRLGQRDPL